MAPIASKSSQENHELALQACRTSGAPKRTIARSFDIPWSTLHEKLSGRRQVEFQLSTVLQPNVEEEIVVWLKEMARRGFGRTKADPLRTVKLYLDSNRGTTRWPQNAPGGMWYRLFRRRHPDIVFRKPPKLCKSRALIREAMVAAWFLGMKATICSIGPSVLLDRTRIYNADEAGFSLDAQTGKVLPCSGSKFIFQPLDVGVFSSMKRNWREAVRKRAETAHQKVSKNFCTLSILAAEITGRWKPSDACKGAPHWEMVGIDLTARDVPKQEQVLQSLFRRFADLSRPVILHLRGRKGRKDEVYNSACKLVSLIVEEQSKGPSF
ncbi:tigger transposable element-derived protein 6-like protein [Plakobranchus ocellatus]|uniref:Tigger transposable element-derived protein 6-like protein n=1 Tax=Plakobranchus ocellatus TaxID=259542 RepID=A0AAV4DIN1_9GAST|nr:tigger transposable element-derived protein 6-like protein [Plakobranchus ocellatus]